MLLALHQGRVQTAASSTETCVWRSDFGEQQESGLWGRDCAFCNWKPVGEYVLSHFLKFKSFSLVHFVVRSDYIHQGEGGSWYMWLTHLNSFYFPSTLGSLLIFKGSSGVDSCESSQYWAGRSSQNPELSSPLTTVLGSFPSLWNTLNTYFNKGMVYFGSQFQS